MYRVQVFERRNEIPPQAEEGSCLCHACRGTSFCVPSIIDHGSNFGFSFVSGVLAFPVVGKPGEEKRYRPLDYEISNQTLSWLSRTGFNIFPLLILLDTLGDIRSRSKSKDKLPLQTGVAQ